MNILIIPERPLLRWRRKKGQSLQVDPLSFDPSFSFTFDPPPILSLSLSLSKCGGGGISSKNHLDRALLQSRISFQWGRPIRQEGQLDVLVRRRREGGRSTGSHAMGGRRFSNRLVLLVLVLVLLMHIFPPARISWLRR